MLSSIPDWAFTTAAITLAALAITLFTWNRLRPRTRPKPRCSKCNYDLDGHHLADTSHFPITCPECGKTFTSADEIYSHPRGWVALVATVLALASLVVSRTGPVTKEGWWATLPLSVRIMVFRIVGANDAPLSLRESVQPTWTDRGGRGQRRVYSPWQAEQLLHADKSWLDLPNHWLTNTPLQARFRVASWQPTIRVDAISQAPTIVGHGRNLADRGSYVNFWTPDTISVPTERRWNYLRTTKLFVDLGNGRWHALDRRIPLVPRLDLLKTPIDRDTSARAVLQLGIEGFALGDDYFGLASTGVAKDLPSGVVAGLRLEVRDQSGFAGEARWNQRTTKSLTSASTIVPFNLPILPTSKGDPKVTAAISRLKDWLADPDDRFTVRITTDPEMVLCDFEATHYLDVDITLPGSALKRKPATPAAQP